MGTRYRKEYEVAGRMVRAEKLNMEEYLKYWGFEWYDHMAWAHIGYIISNMFANKRPVL